MNANQGLEALFILMCIASVASITAVLYHSYVVYCDVIGGEMADGNEARALYNQGPFVGSLMIVCIGIVFAHILSGHPYWIIHFALGFIWCVGIMFRYTVRTYAVSNTWQRPNWRLPFKHFGTSMLVLLAWPLAIPWLFFQKSPLPPDAP